MELTTRQSEVAKLVAEGLSGQQIADKLGISQQSVKNHKHRIYSKLNVRNSVQMIRALQGEPE